MRTDRSREWLRRMAEERFPSLADFAAEVGVSLRLVFYWINGERAPSSASKRAVVNVLGDEARKAFVAEDYGAQEAQANA